MNSMISFAKLARHTWLLVFFASCAAIFSLDVSGAASESDQPINTGNAGSKSEDSFGPYCGLHSLFGAMRFLGKNVSFVELTKPEYVGSPGGSSMSELIQAAQDQGLDARPMANMTCSTLRQVPCPVILHVKSQHSATQYNHWVLFMGFDDSKARIYDGNRLIKEPCATLTSRWDGSGLLVSRGPIDQGGIRLASLGRFFLYTGLVLIVVNAGYWIQARRPFATGGSPRGMVVPMFLQVVVIVLASTIVLGAFRAFHEDGYLSDSQAVSGLKDFHFVRFLPRVSAADVAARVDAPNTILVDARWKRDFDAGHIPGARNLEPSSPIEVCTRQLSDVPRDAQIIVYCTIEGCSYSGDIAQRLSKVGYTNLTLFSGGWNEWSHYIESHSFDDPGGGR